MLGRSVFVPRTSVEEPNIFIPKGMCGEAVLAHNVHNHDGFARIEVRVCWDEALVGAEQVKGWEWSVSPDLLESVTLEKKP
jgi:hypothetical protein